MLSTTSHGLLAALLSGLALCACGGDGGTDPNPVDAGSGTTALDEARSEKKQNPSPAVTDAAYQQLVAGNNAFAFDMYQQLATAQDNLFYSPLSMSVALAMTWAGAKGSTESQMAQALHFTLPQADLHPAMDKLVLAMAALNVAPHDTQEGSKSVRVSLNNAAWAQKGYQFLPLYLDTIAENYDAGVKLVDFKNDAPGATKTINDWVAAKTEDKIKDLIPAGALTPMTRLVLTNTLYFYANWASCFEKKATAQETFHAVSGDVTAEIMHGSSSTRWASGDGWKLADLPYDGGKLAMTVVLPDAGRFEEIRGKVSGTWLAEADAASTQASVTIALPKFKFTWGTSSIKTNLEALGMKDPFDASKADFSGMTATEPLHIADVLHQAFVGVDESGTEAAAATAVIMAGNGMPDKTLDTDRPFLFLIRDTSTGTLLFVGQVTDPTK